MNPSASQDAECVYVLCLDPFAPRTMPVSLSKYELRGSWIVGWVEGF